MCMKTKALEENSIQTGLLYETQKLPVQSSIFAGSCIGKDSKDVL